MRMRFLRKGMQPEESNGKKPKEQLRDRERRNEGEGRGKTGKVVGRKLVGSDKIEAGEVENQQKTTKEKLCGQDIRESSD